MERYLKVPVEFHRESGVWERSEPYILSKLACTCTHADDRVDGKGATEDEAFADLQRKLGYEEV